MLKALIFFVIVTVILGDNESEENYDRVIELLTNVGRRNTQSYENNVIDVHPVVDDGLWKCGNCSDLNDENVVHSEDVTVGAHNTRTTENTTDYVQVDTSITLDVMRCVVVTTELATAVIRVEGSCSGPTVTLSFLNAGEDHSYTIKVYK